MFTIIYKPTLECNLACNYCYVGLRNEAKKKNETICCQTKIFEKILENASLLNEPNLCVIFHGGEPLLLGQDFFHLCHDLILEKEALYGYKVKKCIQTNLTIADRLYLQNLFGWGYEISTSLDGMQNSHDYFRVNKLGKGTFDKVVTNIKLSQSIGFKLSAICCVSELNVNNPLEVYDIFNELGVNAKFNYLESETNNLPQKALITPEQYAKFIIEITNIWLKDNTSNIDILPSSDMISAVVNGYSESCNHASNCQKSFVCVGPDGDVWPCGKCIELNEFRLGNVFNTRNGIVSFDLRDRIFGKGNGSSADCLNCEYFDLCKGLCPFDNYADNGQFKINSRWCRAYKMLWMYMSNMVDRYDLRS